MPIKIKNATSNCKTTFDTIQKVLAAHKAQKIAFEYDGAGRVKGIAFALKIGTQDCLIQLPARIDKVAMIMYGAPCDHLSEKDSKQAYQTAWANIRDWIAAQMAMVDTEMVQMTEVFLPYFVHSDNKTHFEHCAVNPQLLLN